MLPVNSDGHPGYQKFLKKQIFNIFPIPSQIPDKFALIFLQFYNLDLSDTDFIMQKCYSKFGSNPRLPSLMLRSYLLSIKLQFHSIVNGLRCYNFIIPQHPLPFSK
ncbi:MAG: hypothetical protein LBT51_00565 [Fusobacteriaceae bacterium]|jgi:hypothetical protein|nr:hypothetical protein [Fusobacteriaceae bacterium]